MAIASLITTVYNRAPYLKDALESILAQTYSDFELIVWDDGSSDTSVQIAQHYAAIDPRIRIIAAAHQGFTPSLQSAFALATSTYVGWIDSDDYLAPTALAETVAILDAHPEVGLVYTDYQQVDEHNRIARLGSRCSIPYSKDRLLIDFMVFHFRLMHRSVFEQVGGIHDNCGLVPDYDLCLRLSEVTQIHHLQRPLYYYRVHPQSMSQQQQLDTVQDSKAAVERALQRRGLSDRFQLNVQLEQEHTRLRSRFSIEAKTA